MIADIVVMYMLGTWRFAVTKVHVGRRYKYLNMGSSAELSSAWYSIVSRSVILGVSHSGGQSLWGSVILEVSAMIDNHSSQSLRLHVVVIMTEEEVIGCCSCT